MNSPHVLIFANREPEYFQADGEETVSMDRWVVTNLKDEIEKGVDVIEEPVSLEISEIDQRIANVKDECVSACKSRLTDMASNMLLDLRSRSVNR